MNHIINQSEISLTGKNYGDLDTRSGDRESGTGFIMKTS